MKRVQIKDVALDWILVVFEKESWTFQILRSQKKENKQNFPLWVDLIWQLILYRCNQVKMRRWRRMAPSHAREDTQTEARAATPCEDTTGEWVVLQQFRERPRTVCSTRNKKKFWNRYSSSTFRGRWLCQHLAFRPPASRMMGEEISDGWGHPVYGSWFQQA
jgi:hypothetical protein